MDPTCCLDSGCRIFGITDQVSSILYIIFPLIWLHNILHKHVILLMESEWWISLWQRLTQMQIISFFFHFYTISLYLFSNHLHKLFTFLWKVNRGHLVSGIMDHCSTYLSLIPIKWNLKIKCWYLKMTFRNENTYFKVYQYINTYIS